jgi:biofilm PGA synthesis lipoprotein PgaB
LLLFVALAATLAPGAHARALFPRFHGGIPVLLYHRLTPSTNGYGLAPADFAAQMRGLHDLGFRAISLDQYIQFVRGKAADLPPRPVLITFDDGYVSSFKVADPILASYGWNASIYIPTGFIGTPGRLSWAQLRHMRATGRWQIDEHAGDGHVDVTVDSAGNRGPFYANEIWANGVKESFHRYKQRVSRDIELGQRTLARHIPDWRSHGTFAVPFNNYGQHSSNDPRIEQWLGKLLRARFAAVFLQAGDGFSAPGTGFENRIEVPGGWDASSLEAHLLDGRAQLSTSG